MRLFIWITLILQATIACSTGPIHNTPSRAPAQAEDEFLWLENIKGADALKWVKERNDESLTPLMKTQAYKRNEADIRRVIFAKDRLPRVSKMGPHLYNFWQDEVNVRGLWRRTTLEDYKRKKPKWETVLDLDALGKKENENWVWKGSNCLPPDFERCLITLSRGGQDASVVREFDIKTKAFVTEGFSVPEAKSDVTWVTRDSLLVATDYGPGSLTKAGYPRIVKLWKRGTPLAQARTLLEVKPEDMSVGSWTMVNSDGRRTFVARNINFYEDETYTLEENGSLAKVSKPINAPVSAWFNGQVIIQLRAQWKEFTAGSIVALPKFQGGMPQLIFSPNDKQSVASLTQVKDALIINYLDTIQGKVARAFPGTARWEMESLPLPEKGDLSVASADPFGELILANFETFLTPSSILAANVGLQTGVSTIKYETLKTLPPRFDSKRFAIDQYWATSKDGTKVPYFIVYAKKMKLDGSNPVLQHGYGGFEISQTPFYMSYIGKVWLEKGGVYVLANIRGGGEFGPKWHEAALKQNRQKSFDDFAAVSEDLIARKITRPDKLAIEGGSNGGLLVGATYVQRPDIYRAVVCQVPLLDMLRYNKLLAGASWEAEYGNPEDAAVRPAILSYSPYQNLKPGVKYPEVFFMTSTLDDRVHPGHARKMVARMKSQGHAYLYFENTEGGHGAAANLEQKLRMQTLTYTFLQDRLIKR